jgi:N-acetylglucosamine-6-phosphate deacetylase
MLRAKGIERTILVTDALALAGLPPGVYASAVGGDAELLPSGRVVLSGTPYLAGSAATLGVCLGNAVRHGAVTVAEAVRMVTANPARLLGLGVASGHETVRVGADANLTVFRLGSVSSDPAVIATVVAGQLAWSDGRVAG